MRHMENRNKHACACVCVWEKAESKSRTWRCSQQLQRWNSASWWPPGSFPAHQHPGHTPASPQTKKTLVRGASLPPNIDFLDRLEPTCV